MARHMAVDIDRAGHTRDMGRQRLNVYGQGCGPAAEALRPDAELVDAREELVTVVAGDL